MMQTVELPAAHSSPERRVHPLRCVHIITGLSTGGAERMLQKLVYATEGRGLLNEVVCLSAEGAVGVELEAAGIPVTNLALAGNASSLRRLAHLGSTVRAAHPDVVQTWMYHANLLGGLALARRLAPPVVWNIRASSLAGDEKLSTRLLARGSGMLARALARRIVINSYDALAHHVSLGYPADLFEVIPNGFDLEIFRPDATSRAELRQELRIGADSCLIGIVARLHPMKGHPTFLDAAARLAAMYPDVHFVLVGKGVDPEFGARNAAARESLAGRLHALGPRADIPRILAGLDVYTSTSYYGEAFPNVLGEAMACGVPCVTSDVGDSARIVGDTGIVVPVGDAMAVVTAWRRILDEAPDERRSRGRRARERISREYPLARVATRYLELYRDLQG